MRGVAGVPGRGVGFLDCEGLAGGRAGAGPWRLRNHVVRTKGAGAPKGIL